VYPSEFKVFATSGAAASRCTAAQLHTLTRAAARFRRAVGDTPAAVAAVVEFFTAVAKASGNQVLSLSQAPLNLLLAPALTQIIDRLPQARGRIQAAQDHITAAIKRRDRDAARSWMDKHIRDFKRGFDLSRQG